MCSVVAFIVLVVGFGSFFVAQSFASRQPTIAPEARERTDHIPSRRVMRVDNYAPISTLNYGEGPVPIEPPPAWLVRLRTRASASYNYWGAYVDSRVWNSYSYARLDQFFHTLLKTPGLIGLIATKLSSSVGITAMLAAGIASQTR